MIAGWLGACARSEPAVIDPAAPADIRVTLPPFPTDLGGCAAEAFPSIPDRDLTVADTAGIIGAAKILDRRKTRCLRRAVTWAEAVRRDFAEP